MNANNETTLHPTTKEELRAIIEQELKRQGADADLNHIDVSGVTDMSFLFDGLDVRNIKIRNIKIDKWDTSNVTDMRFMFFGLTYFNGDPSAWDVSNVTNKQYMLCGATSFNEGRKKSDTKQSFRDYLISRGISRRQITLQV